MFPNQNNNTQKVSSYSNLYNIIFYITIQGPNNPRYKTTLCKHYNTPQGCSYGDKCQFAHGQNELRLNNAQGFAQVPMGNPNNVKQNSMLNYKIVKCKNFEKDGSCKYGAHCTFAHGDKDLRNKSENLYQMNNNQMMMMMPFPYGVEGFQVMMPPPGVDMAQMQQMMAAPGGMGQNPPYMMMNMIPQQNSDNMNNAPNNESGEQKADNTQQQILNEVKYVF